MKTLLLFPGKELKKLFYLDSNYYFVDEFGWWILDEEKANRFCIKLSEIELNPALFDINLRKQIYHWMPIWTRWIGDSTSYENMRIETIILIQKFSTLLIKYNIKLAIFHTGIPHHVDTSILTISCENCKIQQLFLYAQVFDGRLLPLSFIDNIVNRKSITFDISNTKYEKIIDEFIKNKLGGNPPKTNTIVSTSKKNYLKSLIKATIFYLKLFLIKNFRKNNKEIKWTFLFKPFNFLETLNVLKNQKDFLAYYNKVKYSISDSINFINNNVNKIVIAAHYQPEATTFPEGNQYSNHIEIILTLRKIGFSGIISYKEHPASWMYYDDFIGLTRVGIYRSKRYIEILEELNIKILHEKTDLKLSNKFKYNYIPVTITGTIAIERSLAGLHTIVAGEPWYKGMPGVINLKTIDKLIDIPDSWLIPDQILAFEAKSFLLNKLNNHTIINVPGIGNGLLMNDKKSKFEFKNEINNLIKNLTEKNEKNN